MRLVTLCALEQQWAHETLSKPGLPSYLTGRSNWSVGQLLLSVKVPSVKVTVGQMSPHPHRSVTWTSKRIYFFHNCRSLDVSKKVLLLVQLALRPARAGGPEGRSELLHSALDTNVFLVLGLLGGAVVARLGEGLQSTLQNFFLRHWQKGRIS